MQRRNRVYLNVFVKLEKAKFKNIISPIDVNTTVKSITLNLSIKYSKFFF